MSFKGVYYILAAVVVGLVAVIAMNRVISLRTKPKVEASTRVVVAEANINAGTTLTPRLLKTVEWPQRLCPVNTAQSISQVEGRVLTVPLSKGEPIIFSKLAPEGTAAGLGGMLKEDMRAFTLKVDDVSGVAGFIHPGDHVDVLVALRLVEGKGEEFSKVILQDLTVLSAGQTWQQTGSGDPKSVNTATLEVTPQQSEVLNLASTQGKIRLALRNRANLAKTATHGVTTTRLIHGADSSAPQKGVQVAVRKKKTIAMIRGMDASSVPIPE
jgi:pilus assembly protein CpaB